MPSPIGHALAGTAVAWGADALDRQPSSTRLVATCALLATVADVDLLLPRYHRSVTHSAVAVVLVLIIAAVVTGRVKRWRIALVCAVAYASHPLLDWLGADTLPPFGIQFFWPFVHQFFVSGFDVFAETERRHPFSGPTLVQNLRAVVQEVAIIGPLAVASWLVRVKALARFPSKVAGRDHAT